MKKHLVLTLLLASAATSFAQAPTPTPTPTPAPAPGPGGAQPAPQPAPPQAQPPAPDDAKAKAKAAYDRGLSHYNLGEFDAAITDFKEAYALSSAPGLLFNIAQSYRLKKDYEQATYFYTTYLRLKPDAPNREDVEARLKEMDDLIKQQKEMDAKKPTGVIAPEGGGSTTTTTTTGTTGIEKEKPQPEGGVPPKTLITAGYATAGAGAALVITGVIFGSMAKSNESDLNKLNTDMGTWSADAQSKYDAGKRDNTIAIVSFIVGGAAVATGGTLWFLGTQKKKRMESVAIVPTAKGTTFAVGWSF